MTGAPQDRQDPPDSPGPGAAAAGRPAPGPWRRRVLAPLVAQLTQGVSPERLSATLAVGAGCSLFPLLGTTSLLNLAVGVALRMNQPVLQTLNQLLTPVHLALILVYVRLGELVVGAEDEARFSIPEMVRAFADLPFTEFLERFGRAGLHAILGWGLTLPLLVGGVYLLARPLVLGFAARLRAAREKSEVP